ncbi:MAG: LptF/LptG family permease [Candidatus Omnitrophota bacterium]
MRILDRYISNSVISIFVSTILIFCFLYILIDVASNLSEIIDRKVPLNILLLYYSTFLPVIFIHTSPIACLLAVLLTFSRLNNNNEIIALRSSGLNFWRIAKPALSFALIVSALAFWVNERYVPQASANSEDIRNENIILQVDTERKKKADIKNLTFYGLKNRLFFIDSFDPNTYELKGITIIGQDDRQNMREKIVALEGVWTGIAWKFHQVQMTSFEESDGELKEKIKYYEFKLMDIKETPKDFLRQRLNVTSMNIQQLYSYINRFSHSGAVKALNNLKVDFYQKIAFPFRNIVIVLLGLPLVFMTERRKAATFTSIGIAIGIGFFYYVIEAVSIALGKGGAIAPLVSACFAPFIFCCIAFYLIRTKFA